MTNRATIRTGHADPAVLAAALRPDNTAEMETVAEDDAVVTTVERETIGGLRTTVDDYVVNLAVAETVADGADGSNGARDDPARRDRSAPDVATENVDADRSRTTDAATSTRRTNADEDTDHE